MWWLYRGHWFKGSEFGHTDMTLALHLMTYPNLVLSLFLSLIWIMLSSLCLCFHACPKTCCAKSTFMSFLGFWKSIYNKCSFSNSVECLQLRAHSKHYFLYKGLRKFWLPQKRSHLEMCCPPQQKSDANPLGRHICWADVSNILLNVLQISPLQHQFPRDE